MDSTLVPSLVTLVSDLGFPVVMVLYLLFRFEKRITALAQSIDRLKEAVSQEK
ncbi:MULTISPECIES: YvrJ family protein [Sediminibacillus]|uniref:YvrJ protein family protein n=1 Tax=Sediminibacillus halophilus TaxID=482461 RepID=A0A1G9PCQ5_9BACI|nr:MULTISPECIES: YvrJ family protein [Sediminibacillus]SDL96504.1 YvrJ protein family protein [Sediminibacillus halophilus]